MKLRNTLILFIVLVYFLSVLSIYISNSIIKPIIRSIEIAENIGNLDLTERMK